MASDVAAFLRPVLKRAQAGEHVEYERIGQNAHGQRRWMHGRMAPDLDSTGKVRGLYCTEYDIHDLKQTEQELAAREKQLRLFTDNIPEPVVYLDAERHYVFVNEAFLDLYGLSRDEVLGKKPEEVLGVEGSQALTPDRDRAAKSEALTYERVVIDVVGRTRWIRARCVPDLHLDGSVRGEYVVGHDITDLKVAQDALAARESQLRAIMDGVPAPVAYIDRDERCHYVNRTFLQYFGLSRRASRPFAAARSRRAGHLRERPGDADARAAGRIDGVRSAGAGRQRRAPLDDDPRRARRRPVGRGQRRVRADERHPWPEAGAGGVARVRRRAAAHHGQRAGARVVHRSRISLPLPERPQRALARRLPQRHDRPADLRGRRRGAFRVAAAAARPRAERRSGDRPSSSCRSRRASMQWEAIHYAPHRDNEGNVIGIYAVHTDIHDQKKNEDALRRANWMLSSHISNTPLAVLEWDRDLKLVRWSPQAESDLRLGWRRRCSACRSRTTRCCTKTTARRWSGLINRLLAGHEPRARR